MSDVKCCVDGKYAWQRLDDGNHVPKLIGINPLLLVNDGDEKDVDLDLGNVETKYARVTRLDEEYPYRYTGESLTEKIHLPKQSFVEILL